MSLDEELQLAVIKRRDELKKMIIRYITGLNTTSSVYMPEDYHSILHEYNELTLILNQRERRHQI